MTFIVYREIEIKSIMVRANVYSELVDLIRRTRMKQMIVATYD